MVNTQIDLDKLEDKIEEDKEELKETEESLMEAENELRENQQRIATLKTKQSVLRNGLLQLQAKMRTIAEAIKRVGIKDPKNQKRKGFF